MKHKYLAAILSSALFIFCINGQTIHKPELNSKKLLSADSYLKATHLNSEHVDNIVKVVYFHAADQAPLNNWQERLTTTLKDVSTFYREEFAKFGIQSEGIPFEKLQDGQFVFHMIQGSLPSKEYTIYSGKKIQNDIYAVSNHQIDFIKDHVLIINGLCDKKADGSYLFHSPYHGMGSSVNGVCQVADCELLDSRLLDDTTQRMTFSEMFVTGKNCTVAEFNSWYIGGIAHEMGHMFGLPHDFGNPLELDSATISLMGQYGSRHYREYLWNNQKSSAFTSAGILQLMSHPVFAQTKKLQTTDVLNFNLSDFKFFNTNKELFLKMNYKASVPPYGIVALVRPSNGSEYFNRSFSKFSTEKNSLSISLGFLTSARYFLQLKFLFPDGSVVNNNKEFIVDYDGNAEELINTNGRVDIKAFYEKLSKKEKTPSVNEKLQIIKWILNPSQPVDPITYAGAKLYLSDAKWEKASVGWENIARNYYTCENESTFFLENMGKLYSKGLFAHSPSLYSFDLGGKWKKFTAKIGLRDGAHSQGSAKFTVIGDGKILYESKALRVNQQNIVSVDVENVRIVELKAEGTEGHNYNSWAIWLNPLLEK